MRITLRLAPYRKVSSREVYVAFEAQLLPLLKVAMKKHTRNTKGKTAGDAITARAQRGRRARPVAVRCLLWCGQDDERWPSRTDVPGVAGA